MSVLAGTWHLDGRPVDSDLEQLTAPLLDLPGTDQVRWVDGAVGFACLGLPSAGGTTGVAGPADHEPGVAVAFDGRLDNRDELFESIGSEAGLSPDASDATIVAAAYAAYAGALPERLLGDFAVALFDPVRRELLLARDGFGLRPLYFWRSRDTVLFASTIKSLLAHPLVSAGPDDAVVARFLTSRLTEDDRWATCFAGISTLPPAHVAIVSPGRFTGRRYWDLEPGRRVCLAGAGEYAEAFREHFDRAVARRLRGPSPVAVSLSGGLDSSSVYCVAQTLRRRRADRYPGVLAVSSVYPGAPLTDERRYLLDIERAFGVSVERVGGTEPVFRPDRVRDELWWTEIPFPSTQPTDLAALFDRVYAAGARALLTGHFGDEVLVNEDYLVDLFCRGCWLRVWSELREIPRWFTDAEPGIFVRNFFTTLAKYHLPRPALDAYRQLRARSSPAAGIASWYTRRVRRDSEAVFRAHRPEGRLLPSAYQTALCGALRSLSLTIKVDWHGKLAQAHGLEERAPFLDRDLVAFLVAIPGEAQTRGGVPKSLLRDAMRPVVPDSIVHRHWKGDYTRMANDVVNQCVPWLLDRFRSGALSERFGYVDGARAVAALEGRRPVDGDLFKHADVWRLAGLELWLEAFFGDRREAQAASGAAREQLA